MLSIVYPNDVRILLGEVDPLVLGEVFIQGSEQRVLGHLLGHGERAHGVHVGGHYWYAVVLLLAVAERVLPAQVHVAAATYRASLRTNKHVLEVELYVGVNARHKKILGSRK